MEKFFRFKENRTSFKQELLAGLTTFLTMSYIIFVNPAILAAADVPFAEAATATAIGAALMCVCMGLFTNRPIALASGMGLNAVLAFSVIGIQQSHVPWQVGMAVIFVEGVIILILVITGLREAVMNAIPLNLKRAIGVGIGLLITVIGLNQGGIIRPAPITLVSLGDFSQKYVWVTFIGIFAMAIFTVLKIKGHILLGMLVAAIAAIFLGVAKVPAQFVGTLNFGSFFAPFAVVNGKMALISVFTPVLLVAVFSIMLTDFFDTMGTVVAVAEQAGFLSKNGKIQGIKGILVIDSIAAAVGGLFGASSITSYVESAAGVAEGGRTGLTVVITGILFAIAAFFAPVIKMIGGGYSIPNANQYQLLSQGGFVVSHGEYFVYPITAGALIIVGFLMIKVVKDIHWDHFEEAFPAFLTIIGIPLTYNISHGIGFGFISYTVLKILNGKFRDVHPLMYGITIAFILVFVLPFIGV